MKLVKTANGKVRVSMTKKEWLKMGQDFGVDSVNDVPVDSGVDVPTDNTPVEEPVEESSGETPVQKLRRLVGELQSVVDELDTEPSADTDSPVEDVDTDLSSNPADQAL